MKHVETEEIETISATFCDGRYYPAYSKPKPYTIRIAWTEHEDGTISDLVGMPMLEPAIINGKKCTPNRRYTKESLMKALERFNPHKRGE